MHSFKGLFSSGDFKVFNQSGKKASRFIKFLKKFISVFYVFCVVFIHAYNKRHFSVKKVNDLKSERSFIWVKS